MKVIIKYISIISVIILLIFSSKVFANENFIEDLTTEEKEYIQNNKEIYIAGEYDSKPVQFYDSNEEKYLGIIPEIFEKISEISGIKFVYINKNENWKNYAKTKQAEIICGILTSEELSKYNLRGNIELVSLPIEDEKQVYSIAFTEIADNTLINIFNKTLIKINDNEKQEIIMRNLLKYKFSKKEEYVLFIVEFITLMATIIIFIMYKKSKKELKQAKYIDNITKRGNYQNMELDFNTLLTEETRQGYCVINIGLDIAHMEEVYGYAKVEEILKYTADILNKYVKENESFARVYKDSFIILANYVFDGNITERTINILQEIQKYNDEGAYSLKAYAGIYFLKKNDSKLSNAVYYAMQARKEAEQQGTNVKKCTDALIMKINKQNILNKQVLEALDNNEFVPYFQPLIRTESNNEIAAIEVLARWENPKEGLVKPGSFIHILKENNIIDTLDFVIYEKACESFEKRFLNGKKDIIFFCNFSRDTIEKKDFFENIKNIAEKYKIPKRYVGIVISDGLLYKNSTNLKMLIEKLRNEGFSVVLNNFGATLYSFEDLRLFQIDYLKISSKLTDEKSVAITKGIIEMAHGLNIKVICEVFDSKEKEHVLGEIGCDIIQGNSYFQPIPSEEYIVL